MVPARRTTHARARACIAAAALILGACSGDQTPTSITDEPAFSVGPDLQATLTVTVLAPDANLPVKDATVRAYTWNGTSGGVVASELTNANGVATLVLAPGNYCLSARTAPADWQDLVIVAPGGVRPDFEELPATYGPVVSGPDIFVPVTPQSYTDCWQKLPVKVSPSGGEVRIRMAPGQRLQPEVLDLDGTPLTGVDIYAVIPVPTPPWVTNLPEGARTAFLSMYDRTASPADLVVSSNAPFALEFQQSHGPFTITGTVKGTANNGNALSIEAAPLMCTQTLKEFPSGTPGIDFLKVNYGYHALPVADPVNGAALLPDRSAVALQLIHRGDGPVTITLRTDTQRGRRTTTIDYDCANGNCGPERIKYSGNNTQEAFVFHMPKPDGTVKTTVVLTGIPADHQQVLFAAKSKHDAIPLPSRETATDAFFIVPQPKACVIAASNDDKWMIGEI